MSCDYAIRVRNVGKSYQIYERPADRLKQFLWRGRRRFYREFWALRDVTFDVRSGSVVGVVGRNGSGKSTLLQLVCGTLTPTAGTVERRGRVAALLELGSGFNPEFTGRENIFLYGAVLGLSEAEIRERLERITEFADIGEFLDLPVKIYSSGMHVRLAFSVAINVDPDVLVIDEALAVGDARFQQRCLTKLRELQHRGVSMLFVSHDAEAVKRLCDHVVVLQDGMVINCGDAPAMANWYLALTTVDYDLDRLRLMQEAAAARDASTTEMTPQTEATASQPAASMNLPSPQGASFSESTYFRHGDGSCRITDSYLTDAAGRRTDVVTLGDRVSAVVEVEFLSDQIRHLVGVVIRDRLGTTVIGINSWQERIELPEVRDGDRFRYRFTIPIDLRPGYYSVSPSVAYHQDIQEWMDAIENAFIFRVVDDDRRRTVFGIYLPPQREIDFTRLGDASVPRTRDDHRTAATASLRSP
jgi:homopolymeric O-antigen transport system ATP-binding protein